VVHLRHRFDLRLIGAAAPGPGAAAGPVTGWT
jgi:hypothetical protein